MRTVTQSAYGEPSVLEVVEIDRPEPDHGQVLVRVVAAGINPVDVAVRAGWFALLEHPFTLGWDVAGVIERCGPAVSQFAADDDVLGLVAFPAAAGTHADFVLASPNELILKPTGLSFEQAARCPWPA